MIKRKKRGGAEVNASSMADIAFLLLIFFIITSNVVNDRGTRLTLPIIQEPQEVERLKQNVCLIVMNNQNQLLVNDTEMKVEEVPEFIRKFVTNNGRDPRFSTSPKDAVIVFKSARGSSYEQHLKLISKVQGVYFELWAQEAGVSVEDLISWDVDTNENLSKKLDDLRAVIPYNFVIAEQKN